MEVAYLTPDVLWEKYSLLGFVILVLERLVHILYPTLRTCFDTFWYFYDKPASRKDSHRIGEILSCELRFYFPLVFFPVHLKLLTQCRDHTGLRNKYRKSEIRSAECRLYAINVICSVRSPCLTMPTLSEDV